MATIKKKSLKVFTFILLLVFLTSFFLNYAHTTTTYTWFPKQMVMHFSEHLKRFMKYPQRPCSCSQCISETGFAPWFDERFNHTMQPLLNRQNAFLENDTYTWWMKLQRERTPKKLNETFMDLFSVIPGDVDPFLKKGPLVCRMNRAPTAGFEVDVGRKTTHHLVYPESFRELAGNVSMILVPFKTMDLQWLVSALTKGTINFTYVPVPRKIHVNREKILIYHPAFIKYVFDNWLQAHGRYPSTGILSVILSLHICDKVDLYGFGADSKGNWHHYWENNPSAGAFRKTGVHDGDFESNVTSTLASLNKIRIFKGR
ncbi:CMP-N-acetylneuraminate-beta-galactosamide-alpha-2,3-sialyltransferase 1 [Gracilinanus agilis]|uniref:CMP-N-acetylneuraminate-beta-galactosamide- alpha-2,3-sialyltransferase 1 n=1 Tax=Gracilinanus agilis TaxID=191870 RepID=UPI001CFD575E|nr:CMP-N-acetylneuraminate-beta-galactosamide-alpha-2,3-sialyltransferase 1 [Gracilinanus agilis]